MSLKQGFKKNNKQSKVLILIPLFFNQGKEFETKLKEKKPGDLSDELRTALGMPIGPNNQLVPPPWLIAMQRYGPPPSYPSLKIPGLNAPIPEVRMEKRKCVRFSFNLFFILLAFQLEETCCRDQNCNTEMLY